MYHFVSINHIARLVSWQSVLQLVHGYVINKLIQNDGLLLPINFHLKKKEKTWLRYSK